MALTKIAEIILLILLVVCAVGVNFGKSLLQAVIIFMSYSSIMCILWVLLESPAVHADAAENPHRRPENGGAAAGGGDERSRTDR